MKTIPQKLALYLFNNFIANFIGFVIGMASTRLVSHFFATRNIKNLWGLTSRKTLVDKQTFGIIELTVSVVIGFIVFEIISKAVKKKMEEASPAWICAMKNWFVNQETADNYTHTNALARSKGSKRIYRDVQ
jgi:hypothetical protein